MTGLPARTSARVCEMHIDPLQLAVMMQLWGANFAQGLGMLMLAGGIHYDSAIIYNVGDRELLVRNQPNKNTPKSMSATVTLDSFGVIRFANVEDQ